MKQINSNYRQMLLLLVLTGLSIIHISAQSPLKKIGIIYIDSKGFAPSSSVTQVARIELGKLNKYDVIDRYDVEDMLKRNEIKDSNCLGKECLIMAGKKLNSDFVLSGSIEKYPNKVLLILREIEVSTGNTTNTIIKDFPDVTIETGVMFEVALKDMYGIAITDPSKQNLDNKNKINTAVTNPDEATISIGGPRFGFAFFTGSTAEFLQRPKSQGGYGGYPALFQYGYQFEKVYLNEGNLQALIEFIPTLSGMDQGKIIPSFTLLNGFRSANNGWEFALGPTITWTKEAKGFVVNDKWYLEKEWETSIISTKPEMITKSDTRGTSLVSKPGLLIAVGKTFKSGNLNMPLNFYLVPRKGSMQIGVSYGFNSMKKSTNQ